MYAGTGIKKHYGGVRALDGVDVEIRPGEVQALLGANGAGKSTLVKVLVGAVAPTEGSLVLDGQPVQFRGVSDAVNNGVAIVSQELNLFPELSVLQNLFLLREPRKGGVLLDVAEMRRGAEPVMRSIGLDVALDRRVGELSLAEQQLVEIARALLFEPKVLFLDEPTSALQAAETQRLLNVIRRLRDSGVGIVYVSHMLEDAFAIADSVTVLRGGRAVVSRRPCAEMTVRDAVTAMLGDVIEQKRETTKRRAAPVTASGEDQDGALRLRGVGVERSFEPLDLEVLPGEIVGLAGLEGSGARDVLDVLFGQRRPTSGEVTLPGGSPAPRSVNHAVRAGVALVPADRKRSGVMLDKTVFENITMVSAGPMRRMGFLLRRRQMVARAEHWRGQLGITMDTTDTLVGNLSGGNQQKVMVAKWLEADPRLVLLDDPTRGVDVGAKADVHTIIGKMAAEGRVIVLVSSDLEEMSDICDRVVVFAKGRACGEIPQHELSEHRLLEAINTGDVRERVSS